MAILATFPGIVLLSLAFLGPALLAASDGGRDPFFSSVPFEAWQQHGKRKDIRWSVDFFPIELSVHQRLLSRVRIEIARDSPRQAVPRRLVVLIEYRDDAGKVWRTHVETGAGSEAANASVLFGNAFVLPGNYLVSVAAYDPSTREHSFLSRRIHVKPLANDPLPLAWGGLPEVELLPAFTEPPDEWFLPTVESRMTLRVPTRRPVRLDVFVNTTPGGNMAGSVGATRRNMSVLIPAVKVISQMELAEGSINVRVVDLARRRIVFRQDGGGALDWTRLREVFLNTRPGIIDVSSLAGFWKMRNFFWEQIITSPPAPGGHEDQQDRANEARAVVVLSGPAFFPGQEQLPEDVRFERRAAAIFYIRYRPPDMMYRRIRPRPGAHPLPPRMVSLPLPEDDLELAARKLDARIFDVITPGDFRRVLAAIFGQIADL